MHKPLGYVVAALMGAVLAVIVGYFAFAAGGREVNIGLWLDYPLRFNIHLWALLGAALGLGARYLAVTR